ncbi:MAG: exodeoxyribonuclease V subunit gamma [Planctomycetes bacterium]|nr:exodeoxyribonuclease V subunit gamma [Planctomycetota bacterium]
MSTLYLAPDLPTLADRLADEIEHAAHSGDCFVPTSIVVANRYVRKWLRFHLARKHGVAINLNFLSLDDALWHYLQQTDPAVPTTPPEAIDDNTYRLMVLSVLLEESDPHLQPLRRYVQMDDQALSRLTCRRAWYLADRLGLLVRAYEYDRQDTLIQPWLRGEFGLNKASEFHTMMERAQRALFLHITREPDGRRALLNRLGERTFKTLPQYAMELMTANETPPSPPAPLPEGEGRPGPLPGGEGSRVHFFGFTHLCDLHARTIGWLGRVLDVRLYCPSVHASRLGAGANNDKLPEIAQSLVNASGESAGELARLWGKAGAGSLALLAPCAFDIDVLSASTSSRRRGSKSAPATVLARLQNLLRGGAVGKARLAQDTSVQIVGCPGLMREVETVHDSIVNNLQNDSSLRQTDIVVLTTDMPRYRAALQSVFERPPRRLQYNLVDFNAASVSTYGQALLGMFDLALESFSRSRVFQVILNPCFLARMGVERQQATAWLEWAESLGIHQGWDAQEKQQQGYPNSPLYTWRHGLQRLRLGRFMDVASENGSGPTARFGQVIPFADLASTEREQLDAFCRAVEGLLPTLTRLRSSSLPGARWASTLHRLAQEFLDVPVDRPEETQVRDQLVAGFETLAAWDSFQESKHQSPGLPLALVREFVRSQLEVLEGSRGDYLIGGVTVAALEPMRALPFEIVYLVGLGENTFPGSNALSSFDLRDAARLAGDIRPAEQRLHDFLATILSARKKLYLFFDNHDVQKDQAILPSVPLQQLQRHLGQYVVNADFEEIKVPNQVDDACLLDLAKQPSHQDVLVQTRDVDRLLALASAERENRLALDKKQRAEWDTKSRAFQTDFSIAPQPRETQATGPTIPLVSLKRFLQLPAQEALRRHLGIDDDDEKDMDDDEPLVAPDFDRRSLVRQTIQGLILSAVANGVDQALAGWQQGFDALYADANLRCRVPEAAFGDLDRAALRADLQERIHGQGRLESFLRERAGLTFCGPVLLGESLTPMGARLRFPALGLPRENDTPIRLVGWTEFAWHDPGRFEILVITTAKIDDGREIHTTLLEPALLHLAFLANAAANAEGVSPQAWLADREVVLHVAHTGGIVSWQYPPGSITPAEATAHLFELSRDLLDPGQFDLLPLDALTQQTLRFVLHGDQPMRRDPGEFRAALEEMIAEELEKGSFATVRIPGLVQMIGARVPADALAKVERRFHLLDRGPARQRRQPVVIKPKRAKASASKRID